MIEVRETTASSDSRLQTKMGNRQPFRKELDVAMLAKLVSLDDLDHTYYCGLAADRQLLS